MHNLAQFSANQSNHWGDMADFRFLTMAAIGHLGFVLLVFGPPNIWWSL